MNFKTAFRMLKLMTEGSALISLTYEVAYHRHSNGTTSTEIVCSVYDSEGVFTESSGSWEETLGKLYEMVYPTLEYIDESLDESITPTEQV